MPPVVNPNFVTGVPYVFGVVLATSSTLIDQPDFQLSSIPTNAGTVDCVE